MPEHGTRTDQLALEMAVQHGAAGQHDGRQVGGGRSHQAGRGGLVATGGEHHAIQGKAVQDLHQAKVGQVAIQGRGGAATLLGNGVHREFHGDTARVADTGLDPLGQLQVMTIAGREIAAGLGDADDRPARLEFVTGQAVVHVALDIERGHVGVGRIIEPLLAAQRAFGGSHDGL